jgi:hypothetical protein
MGQIQNLLNRLSNVFAKDTDTNLGQLMGAIGSQLDAVDPSVDDPTQNKVALAKQFSMSTATGSALDMHGADWGVPRRFGEDDKTYRARIQAVLPICTNGPTVQAISDIVQNFTGTAPIILEYGPQSFYMGVTPMGEFVFNNESPFSFQVQVQNPDGHSYKKSDLEDTVNQAKPARATALFVHATGGI